jgi:hypothetical protein
VTIANTFDGVEYRGTVDSWRCARKRSYYHVTYTDGDEEELSQTELRDGYLLGLTDVIEAEWKKSNSGKTHTNLFPKRAAFALGRESHQASNLFQAR